ncbi:hypothetical protein MMC26_005886 [Xylographa opegraphella]|nr:hypothetical protein [Xylographa opegraphella]
MPPSETDAAYHEYLARGRLLWQKLSRELITDSPDAPMDSERIFETWELNSTPFRPPPAKLIGPLRSLHLPFGNDYTRVKARTPKAMPYTTITNFQSLYNVENGVIITEEMFRKEEGINAVRDQALLGKQHWSQVTVECWRRLCRAVASLPGITIAPASELFTNLRYIFMVMITSDKTEAVINERLMLHQPSYNGPPTTFLPNNIAFYVLLGSPNGQGVAYMLAQNKNAFKRKTIKSVTLQSITPADYPGIWWHLWWEIG